MRYTTTAKIVHWTIAVLIIAQFVGGKFMTHLPLSTDLQYLSYQLHKSFGFTILFLTLFRIYWRVTHKPPPLEPGMAGWERIAARVSHIAFYVFLVVVPLLGWAVVSTIDGVPTKLFWLIPIPDLPLGDGAHDLSVRLHAILATAMIALLVVHVGAALKHHFVDRDRTFVRMLTIPPGADGKRAITGIVAGLLAVALVYIGVMLTIGDDDDRTDDGRSVVPSEEQAERSDAGEAGPDDWIVDEAGTYVMVDAVAYGQDRNARIDDVAVEITFDPDAPQDTGRIVVTMPLDGVDAGDTLTNNEIRGPNWFDVADHPVARFVSDDIVQDGDGYVARGTLTIAGEAREVELPFTLDRDGARAIATGALTLDRREFGLGPQNDGQIGAEVAVTVAVDAVRAAPQ